VLSISTDEHDIAISIPALVEAVLKSEHFNWAIKAEGGGDEDEDEPLRFAGRDVASERLSD
jgi:hypothetical protein